MIQVRLPSGRVVAVNTDDPKVAGATARAYVAKDPYETKRAELSKDPAAKNIYGGLATFERAIPFLTEAGAGLGATANTAGDLLSGKGVDFGKRWKEQRAIQQADVDAFKADHPIASGITTLAGNIAPIAAAILSGGATEAPAVAAKAPEAASGVASFLKPLLTSAAKRATAGASAGYIYGASQPGTLAERGRNATGSATTGAVVGTILPPALQAAGNAAVTVGGKVASTVARAANKATGGALLDAGQTAAQRLTAALKADGADAASIRAAMNGFLKNGATDPSLIDVASRLPSGGANTLALVRAAAAKGSGRGVATTYADQVTADLQDKALAHTAKLTPGETRSPATISRGLNDQITAASPAPTIEPGSGGATVSRALNSRYDAAKAQVDDAYRAARETQGDAVMHPNASRALAANVQGAMADFDPLSVPRVAREVGRVTEMAQPGIGDLPPGINPARVQQPAARPVSLRPLFEARARLTALRASADPVEATAASRATRAVDQSINEAMDAGQFTGDPEAVTAYQNAIGLRRQLGQQFEGDDVIQQLTERERHGEGRTQAVAPEDASNVVLGRGEGVSAKPDLTRDLARVRDTLGADSPEWNAFRQEARGRLLGRDAGTANYGDAWGQFSQRNPQLAAILTTPEDEAALAQSRAAIGTASTQQGALDHGATGVTAMPDEYAANLHDFLERGGPDAGKMAAAGYRSALADRIGAPAEGSTGAINRAATSTNQGRNLEATFGPEMAQAYRDGLKDLTDQLSNARDINPGTNSQTAQRLADMGLVDQPLRRPPTSALHVVLGVLNKVRAGATLTDAERELIARMGTAKADPASLDLSSPKALPAPDGVAELEALALGQTAGQRRNSQ